MCIASEKKKEIIEEKREMIRLEYFVQTYKFKNSIIRIISTRKNHII